MTGGAWWPGRGSSPTGAGRSTRGASTSTIGINLNLDPVTPVSDGPADLVAARRIDGIYNRLFLDPLFRGRYPPDVFEELAGLGWEIDPSGLDEPLLRLHHDDHPPPLFVTENGAAFDDVLDTSGLVPDRARIRFLDGHLRAAHRAIQGGVDLCGYFVWSLLDNFEWAEGSSKRFGIVCVDFPTQRRLPKDSALWYREAIARGGLDGLPSPNGSGG